MSEFLRYPYDASAIDGVAPAARRARTLSNLAERLEVERLFLARARESDPEGLPFLDAHEQALAAIVATLREEEARALADDQPVPSPAPAEPMHRDQPPDRAVLSFRSFGRVDFDFARSDDRLVLNGFHRPERHGRWSGPQTLSIIDLDLPGLVAAGLDTIEVQFAMSVIGEPATTVRFFAGANLVPIGAVEWVTPNLARLSFDPLSPPPAGLRMLTREVRRVDKDPRLLGVSVERVSLLRCSSR